MTITRRDSKKWFFSLSLRFFESFCHIPKQIVVFLKRLHFVQFSEQEQLMKHAEQKSKRVVVCSICKKVFKSDNQLENHKQSTKHKHMVRMMELKQKNFVEQHQ